MQLPTHETVRAAAVKEPFCRFQFQVPFEKINFCLEACHACMIRISSAVTIKQHHYSTRKSTYKVKVGENGAMQLR